MNRGKKAICFDYYMTLVRMHEPYGMVKKWIFEFINDNHFNVDSEKFYSKFTRNRAILGTKPDFNLSIDIHTISLKNTCEYFGIQPFDEMFRCFIEGLFSSPEAYEDSHYILSQLRTEYKVGLFTNADNYILNRSISRNEFTFDFICTSEDARSYKPDPGFFEYAMQSIGMKPNELLMIGDSMVDDIYGAGNSGIETIWVNRNGQVLNEEIAPPLYCVDKLSDIHNLLQMIEHRKY